MNKTIHTLLIATMLTGCGGRTAYPVMVEQYGDRGKGCAALETEMAGIQQRVVELLPDTDKSGKNTALGVPGFFFLVPLFFMDFSHAEQEEVNAYRNRYNHLAGLAADKQCDIDTRPIPALSPAPSTKTEASEYPSQRRRH